MVSYFQYFLCINRYSGWYIYQPRTKKKKKKWLERMPSCTCVQFTSVRSNIALLNFWNDDILFFVFGKFSIRKGKGGKIIILHMYSIDTFEYNCFLKKVNDGVYFRIVLNFFLCCSFSGKFLHEIHEINVNMYNVYCSVYYQFACTLSTLPSYRD